MPKTIDSDIWDSILAQIAQGQSLSTVLTQSGSPSYSWSNSALRADATTGTGVSGREGKEMPTSS